MKVKEVITRALSGEINWMQAAEILGITDRHLRRWGAISGKSTATRIYLIGA